MKKIFFLLAVLISFAASAQIYQPYSQYGNKFKRVDILYNLALPNDTIAPVNTVDKDYRQFPAFATKGDSTYYWSVALQKYVLLVGSSSIDTTNIANFSVKVRSLFSATSPVIYTNGNFSLDTTAGKWRSENYYDTKYVTGGWNGLTKTGSLLGLGGSFSNDVWLNANAHDFEISGGASIYLQSQDAFGESYIDMTSPTAIELNVHNAGFTKISQVLLDDDSLTLAIQGGKINVPNLRVAGSDTTTYKPMVYKAATGNWETLPYWPNTAGGAAQTLQDVFDEEGGNAVFNSTNQITLGTNLFKILGRDLHNNNGGIDSTEGYMSLYYGNDFSVDSSAYTNLYPGAIVIGNGNRGLQAPSLVFMRGGRSSNNVIFGMGHDPAVGNYIDSRHPNGIVLETGTGAKAVIGLTKTTGITGDFFVSTITEVSNGSHFFETYYPGKRFLVRDGSAHFLDTLFLSPTISNYAAAKFHTVGTVRHESLPAASGDTTNYKPLGIDSDGDLIPMTYWPGGGSTPIAVRDSAWILSGNSIGAYGKYIGTNDDFDLRFFTNGTERVRIDSSTGNVGIGGVPTANKLEVYGPLNVQHSTTALNFNAGYLSLVGGAATGAGLVIESNNSGSGPQIIMKYPTGGPYGQISMDASYNISINAWAYATPNIRILEANGYVGINNSTPSESLDVTGNAEVSGTVGIGVAATESLDVAGKIRARTIDHEATPDSVTVWKDQRLAYATPAEVVGAGIATYLGAGTYTPTNANLTNLDATTAHVCQYSWVTDPTSGIQVVTVSGYFEADPTTVNTATSFTMTVPVASTFSNEQEAGGAANAISIVGQSAGISATASGTTVKVEWKAGDTTNQKMRFTYTYKVVIP